MLRITKDGGIALASFTDSSDEVQLVNKEESSSAVGTMGTKAFCKIKAWDPDMESGRRSLSSRRLRHIYLRWRLFISGLTRMDNF